MLTQVQIQAVGRDDRRKLIMEKGKGERDSSLIQELRYGEKCIVDHCYKVNEYY